MEYAKMIIYPVTYILLILWLILISSNDSQYYIRFIMKLSGSLLGFYIAISCIYSGEQWLIFIQTVSVPYYLTSLINVKDGFSYPIAVIIIGISMISIALVWQSWTGQDWKKSS